MFWNKKEKVAFSSLDERLEELYAIENPSSENYTEMEELIYLKVKEEHEKLVELAAIPIVGFDNNDMVVIPVQIGSKSPQKAREALIQLMEIYKGSFPKNYKAIFMPHRDGCFYYPMVIKLKGNFDPDEFFNDSLN